jgi:fructosamine-3-kinase
MDHPIREELVRLLGREPEAMSPLSGGDIGRGFKIELPGGEILFAKTYAGGRTPEQGSEMVAAEARGLAWLAEADAIRVPQVRAVSAAGETGDPVLVLEWIEPGQPAPGTDEALGRGLARLHAHGAPGFGLEADNFIGWLPQSNRTAESWACFYAEQRICPLLERTRREGLLPGGVDAEVSRLVERMPELVGPEEPPARLHGDLWGGNWLCAANGDPVLIDPAVYGGHREIDLAMMKLFGGFSARVFDAYREASPLAEGYEQRVPLYQLYPLLIHLALFGNSYAGQVQSAIRAALEM